jgi:2-polyprenyl-3-methyl-5-hydroxy-6-metoxy-1,4-benzoquinol methylase
MAIKHQPSDEIRDFLVFHLLEQAARGAFPPARLGSEVVRSSEGDLQPAGADVRAAQIACWEHGWLEGKGPFSNEPASLSPEGRRELARRLAAARREHVSGNPREAAADRVVSLVSPADECEVLDVGTGDGFLAKKLAAAGFRVLGVDTDASAVEHARTGHATNAGLRFEVADIHALAERGQRWRTIVTSYLLHECEEPVGVLRAICSCLEPGGRLACMDFAPNCAAYVWRAGRTPFHPFRALAQGDWRELAPGLRLTQPRYFCIGYVAVTCLHKHSEPTCDGVREGGRMETAERLTHLLPHWIEHNESHAEQLAEWVAKARSAGMEEIADAIGAAAEAMRQANVRLGEARDRLAA